jgi:hypothetical protein
MKQINEPKNKSYKGVSKFFLIASMIIATSFIANTGYSQVFVRAHVGFGIPAPRFYGGVRVAPVVVRGGYVPAPAPVAYGYAYPDAALYTYPAWNGHYRDHFYYEHYRPYFERSHRFYHRR